MMKFSFLFPLRHSQLGLTTLLLALTPLVASATHLVGGELDLLHKSGSTYDFGGQDPDGNSLAFRPPNIITPNGDGLNESFALDQVLPPNFRDQQFAGVRVFSRWGQQVYQSPDRTFHWPGAGVGGTYYYLVTFTDGHRFKGWLEVLP